MRSIGSKNIKLVKKLVHDIIQQEKYISIYDISEVVTRKLPSSVFETHESAYSEIQNIINDEVMQTV